MNLQESWMRSSKTYVGNNPLKYYDRGLAYCEVFIPQKTPNKFQKWRRREIALQH
jgi:hypothetical protein